MSVRRDPSRYEIKIPWPSHYLPHVERWVRLHPAQWRVAYPPRQVNNVYFDTADCRCLDANLMGLGERAKLRLRWYGPSRRRVTGAQLELKRRSGSVGWKEILPLVVELDLAGERWSELTHALREAAGDAAAPWLAAFPYPALLNHYRRAYYVTPDGVLRLTLDTQLHAYGQRDAERPNLDRPAPLPDRGLVELKAPVDTPSYQRLAGALAHFPLRPDRHSKYVQGLLAARYPGSFV